MKTIEVNFQLEQSNESIDYPKYLLQLINIANQNSQATRKKNVGSMKDLFTEFVKLHTLSNITPTSWKKYWFDKMGKTSFDTACKKILTQLMNQLQCLSSDSSISLGPSINLYVEKWLNQFLFQRTFQGMCLEHVVAKKLSEIYQLDYFLSDSNAEKEGIDVIIGTIPVQIKPHSSTFSPSLFFNHTKKSVLTVTYEVKGKILEIHIPEDYEDFRKR